MASAEQVATLCRQRCRSFGRAYVVVGASFVMFSLLYGFLFGYNFFFVAFQEEFQSSATLTGWIGIIPLSCTVLLAPLVKIMVARFGSRIVASFGIASASGAMIMTSFMPRIEPMIVTYGLVLGLGAGVVTISVLDLLVMHFPTRNTIRVTALVLSGSSIGTMALTPLHSFVIERYGWRFLFRVFGAVLFAVGLPCALTFAEPSTSPPDINDHDGESSETTNNPHQYSEISAQDENTGDDIHVNNSHGCVDATVSNESQEEDGKKETEIALPPSKEEEFERTDNLPNILEDGNHGNRSEADSSERNKGEICKTTVLSPREDSMARRIATVLTYPELWLICLAVLLGSVGDCFYFVNMISYLLSVGFTEQTGVTMISIFSFSNTAGKFFYVFFGEAIPFPRIFLLMIVYGVGACVILSLIFLRSTIGLYFLAAVVGGVLLCGTSVVTTNLAPDFFGPAKYLETSAVIFFCYGVAYLISSVIGQSIDRTGSYRVALWALLGLYVTSVLLLILATVYQKYCAPARFVTFEIQRQKRAVRKTKAIDQSQTKRTDNQYVSLDQLGTTV